MGRNVIAPSIANPTMNASTTHTENTEERNSRSGRIGSVALLSTNTKITSDSSEPAISRMIVGEPHAYSIPPQDSARVSPAAPSDTNTMPR